MKNSWWKSCQKRHDKNSFTSKIISSHCQLLACTFATDNFYISPTEALLPYLRWHSTLNDGDIWSIRIHSAEDNLWKKNRLSRCFDEMLWGDAVRRCCQEMLSENKLQIGTLNAQWWRHLVNTHSQCRGQFMKKAAS